MALKAFVEGESTQTENENKKDYFTEFQNCDVSNEIKKLKDEGYKLFKVSCSAFIFGEHIVISGQPAL